MGSKNQKFLGIVSNNVLHNIRNVFEKEVYITDRTIKKIEKKHFPLDKEFIYNDNFQIILDNTLMICYDESKKIYNCLSKVNNRFFIYGMFPKNNRTEITTLFKTNPRQINKDFIENEKTIVLKKEFTTD
jgi:hypothetical protein